MVETIQGALIHGNRGIQRLPRDAGEAMAALQRKLADRDAVRAALRLAAIFWGLELPAVREFIRTIPPERSSPTRHW